MATRWGIVSAGLISNDFVTCLRSLPASEHQVVAVAARDLNKAQEFAKKHEIPKAYGSYEELAKDPNVEVVYIGAVNTVHLPVAKLMLEHNKHLLVEKPMTLNLKHTKELIGLAKEKNLFLMEALWSRFLPTYRKLVELINGGAIGDVMFARAEFGIAMAHKERIKSKELGGGGILDLGVYAINAVLMAMKGDTPLEIKATGHTTAEGVDEGVCATLKFTNGRLGVVSTHIKINLNCEAEIRGTKGSIKLLYPFWAADSLIVNDVKHDFPLPDTVCPTHFVNSSGLRYEAMEVRRCLLAKENESSIMPHKDSELIVSIQDALRRQVGVTFPEDI